MNVSMTPELEEFVNSKVKSGRYNSASEVVREALRLLEEHEHARSAQLAHLNDELARRLAALDRGDNDDLITQAFVQKYGTTVIAAPSTTGFNRLAWIMPFLALVLGLVTTALIVREWKDRPAPAAPAGLVPVTGSELERFRRQAREETEL